MWLYGSENRVRRFRCNSAVWLGTEYGAQVWIPEVDVDSTSVSLRT